ncbi:hypothetical protein EJ063_03310 [Vibrio aquaticus]|uniref:Uncharacterized protein n=1 Tax=Vibrio aquaticus TaxID=2496559 RepID=A0A432D1W8_9VIBR|nr:hypothetical protein [Vibrio aquaticus]RTZ17828.1 hypothetical protein EJ063_03310 [Vibrio aquaticus]
MNILSLYEAYGVTVALILFCAIYLVIHVKYIRHHAAHKRFLAALWRAMQNTIHGQHIRTLGYDPDKEKNKKS